MGRRLSSFFGLALVCACFALPGIANAARPNIVLILTDDQRWDTVSSVMPTVQNEIAGHGITFTNAFAVNPLCCPSRATILTGRYSHSTGVYGNKPPYGGVGWFDDSSTIATWLDSAGYRTGFIGKYLNGYGSSWQPPSINRWFVPPGWDRWMGFNGGYYGIRVGVNGMNVFYGPEESNYSTDLFTREAVSFLDGTGNEPFFLVYAPYAPHAAATPPARYLGALDGIAPFRPAAFGEPDVTDKPDWVRKRLPITAEAEDAIDAFRQSQLESLMAVDDGVDAILDTLGASGKLANTMVVFASDNGLLWGEHRLSNRKESAYEESIRLPLMIRYDALLGGAGTTDKLVGNVDLAPTFAALAGVAAPAAEGKSLLPLLAGGTPPWRTRLVIEHLQAKGGISAEVPTYCGVRSHQYKYVVYATHEEELYDLVADPAELVNRASDPALRPTKLGLRADVHRLCNPSPPGFDLSWLCTGEPAPGATTFAGTGAAETICGRKASEVLDGRGGNDVIRGGAGNDRLFGGAGPDRLDGGPGQDHLDGGPSDDIVLARDHTRDRIVCGRGHDLVLADKRDVVARDCEQVRRR